MEPLLRKLGATNLRVSPIGLGLAALGRPAYINIGHGQDLAGKTAVQDLKAHAQSVLDEAWRLGVRYFDVARSYGLAETFLGSWLEERVIPVEAVAVGSKWGYTYTAGWQVQAGQHEVKDHSLHVLQRQRQESKAALGQFLKLYQIHSATLESGVLQDREVLNGLDLLKQAGLAIGLTTSGPDQAAVIRQAIEVSMDGCLLFDSVQATWNLLETSAGEALQEAHAAGLGVIVKEALANGRLTPKNQDPKFAGKFSLLEQQAQRLRASVDALALAAALNQPWASLVLSGAANPQQLSSNMAALGVKWDAQAAQGLASLAEPAEKYWAKRGELAWN